MNNWTIGKRITIGFAAVLTITLALGLFVHFRLTAIQANTRVIIEDCLPGIYQIGLLATAVEAAEKDLADHILAENPEVMAELDTAIGQAAERNTSIYDEYEKTIMEDADRRLFEKITAIRPEYLRIRNEVLALSRAGQKKEAFEAAQRQLEPVSRAYMAAVRATVDYNKARADNVSNETQTAVRNAELGLLLGVLIALALGAGTAFFIIKGTNRALNRVASAIDDGCAQVATAAGQVSATSQTLAEGSSEQAASLEETSSSLEEMASMTQRNASNAQQANELARAARTAADRGAADTQAMMTAMDAIKRSSDDVAKILKTIDEIAFQTNLLALNAAVEAARAGEAGMGFAVVADEVRNLAQRAAAAAKETAEKIDGAITKSTQGVHISNKVAAALNDIVAKARQVDELVSEVAGASREQSQGIAQINTAVGQMDKVTQNNAASAEEGAAAAEELNAQAEAMKDAVNELLHLVDGQSSATSVHPGAVTAVRHARSGVRQSSTVSTRSGGSGRAKGNGHHTPTAAPALNQPTRQTAASAIPMADDFKDF